MIENLSFFFFLIHQVRHYNQPVGDGVSAPEARPFGGGHRVRREGVRVRRRERGRALGGCPPVVRTAEQHLELHRITHDR